MRLVGSVLCASVVAGGCSPCRTPAPEERTLAPEKRWPPRPLWVAKNVDRAWPAVGDQTVVFATQEGHGLLAVDRQTGRQRWTREVPEGLYPRSLIAAGDQVIFSLQPGVTTSVGLADGAPRWRLDLGCFLTHPTLTAGVVVSGCWPTREGAMTGIVAIDLAAGTRRWFIEEEAIIGAPAVDSQTVYVPVDDRLGHLVAIEAASGRERWRTAIEDDLSHTAVAGDTVVALGSHIHGLAAATGEPLWKADRLDGDPPNRDLRTLRVDGGLVMRPGPHSIDGLDPRTGEVAKTWRLRAGELLIWRDGRSEVVSHPPGPGVVLGVVGQLALFGDHEWTATTAFDLAPRGPPDGRPISTVSALEWKDPPRCDWDTAPATVRRAHLDMGLVRGPYVRHRDHLYSGSGGWSFRLADGDLSWLGVEGTPERIAVDDDYFYWGEGDRNDRRLVRVARRNAYRVTLARGLPDIDLVAAAGGQVYWSSGDGLHRIAQDGGRVETVWRGARVTTMVVDRDRLFFVAGAALRSLPSGDRPLATGIDDASPLAFDTDHVYAVARRPDGSSAVLRVPRAGGAVRELFTSERAPQAIAVDVRRVYLAVPGGGIISLGKSGGAPSLAVRELPSNPCGEIWHLEAAGDSLRWIGADRPGERYGSLWTAAL